jgi:hypothetical protein
MIPRNNSTTSNLKANTNNQSRDNKIIFNDLMKLRNISFENGNVLYENKSEMDYIGFIIIVCAFLLFVFSEMDIIIKALIGIVLIIIGLSWLISIKSFSIINTTMNTIYKELRFNSITIYKSKSINIKDIVLLGVDHKRIDCNPKLEGPREVDSKSFLSGLTIALLTGRMVYKEEKKQKINSVDGRVEASAIAYITNDGKINYFNKFSDGIDADKNNIKLAEAIGVYANLPITIAKKDECLEVKRMGSKLTFTSKNIKPAIMDAIFEKIVNISILLVAAIVIFVLLLKFR